MNAYERFLQSDYRVYADGSSEPLTPADAWESLHWQSIVFVRGLPGIGKTTFAKRVYPRWPRFEADDWAVINDEPVPYHERHNLCQWSIDEHLNEHFLTVVANTFVREWEIRQYMRVTLCNTDEPTIVHVHHGTWTDGELSRRTRHQVPETVIASMRLRWEPWPGEYLVTQGGSSL